ncbi:response regulator [Endozoicomonadaceae bacterium StTr2]
MKILLAEDDAVNADYIKQGLTGKGYSVDCVADGREALSQCLYHQYDLFIADRMLPGMDGLSVIKALRASGNQVPVIFLTALSDVDDKVEGLMAGGDDYIAKPFHFSELLARIYALSRRPSDSKAEITELAVHDLHLNLLSRTVERQGQVIALKNKEFALLELLLRNCERIVSKALILERVWGFNFDPGTTAVETHVSKLRLKVDKPFSEPLIHTVRNMGYCIRAPR